MRATHLGWPRKPAFLTILSAGAAEKAAPPPADLASKGGDNDDCDERDPTAREDISPGRPTTGAGRAGAGAADDWRDVRLGLLREPGERALHAGGLRGAN